MSINHLASLTEQKQSPRYFSVVPKRIIDKQVEEIAEKLFADNPGDNGWNGVEISERLEPYLAEAFTMILYRYSNHGGWEFIGETKHGYVFQKDNSST